MVADITLSGDDIRDRLTRAYATYSRTLPLLADSRRVVIGTLRSTAMTGHGLLSHPSCPVSELERAFDRRIPFIGADLDLARTAAVAHEAAPAELLERAAVDDDVILRATAARHPTTPYETVRRLAADPDEMVRRHVAARTDLDDDTRVLLVLVDSADADGSPT
jgi:hypothetical protein